MKIEDVDVPVEFLVRSPSEFEALLRRLLHLLDAGVLNQCGRSNSDVDLRGLVPTGPWPDIVEGSFIDTAGRRYHLFVDTFHGSGGQWRVEDCQSGPDSRSL